MSNKPFDQGFKAVPETNPRGWLEAIGVLEPGEEAEVEAVPQELPASTVLLDVAMVVKPRRRSPFVAIFEAFARFRPVSLEQVVEYAKRADTKWPYDQRIYMVPLVEVAYPNDAPREIRRDKGDYQGLLKLRWLKPWELDAGRFLRYGETEFAAFTALCDATEEQRQEALRRLCREPGQMARYKSWGGLRYRERGTDAWNVLVERIDRMISREDMRESLAVQEWLEEGRTAGLAQGQTEGGRRTAEQLLRVALARFERIVLPSPIPDSVDVTALATEVLMANDEAAVRGALRRHGLIR